MAVRTPRLAKLTRPTLPVVHERKRLFRLLDAARKRPVVWLTAPAGSGKTTLAASYLGARRLPHIWYSIDPGDGDPASFFYYLRLAVGHGASRRKAQLPLLTPEYLPGLPAFTRNFFRLFFARIKQPGVAVFDNFERLPEDSPLHDLLSIGLAEIPPDVTVIVLSRADPPSSLAHLLASGLLALLGWDDLRLTQRESLAIGRLRSRLSTEQLRALHEETQGWVTGLVLLVEHGSPCGRRRTRDLSSGHVMLFDYFAEELFKRTDDTTRAMLLQTSLLPKITAETARQLTGIEQAEALLNGLVRRNYFTFKLAGPSPTYEYHPLFRAFLQSRARAAYSQPELNRLRRRAAALLEADGFIEDAAALLIEAGDWDRLIRLVLLQAPVMAAQGRGPALAQWIRAVPGEMLEKTPWLRYWLGTCRLPFDPVEARAHFNGAFALFEKTDDPAGSYLAWLGLVESVFFEWRDFVQFDRCRELFDDLRRRYPDYPSSEIEARVTFATFTMLINRWPDHPDLPSWAGKAEALLWSGADINTRLMQANHLLYYCTWRGDLAKAKHLIAEIHAEWTRQDVAPMTRLWRHASLAIVYWHTGDIEQGLHEVEEGRRLADATGIRMVEIQRLGAEIFLLLIRGDVEAAERRLHQTSFALRPQSLLDGSYYHHLASMVALHKGQLAHAEECAQSALTMVRASGMPFGEAICLMANARIALETGQATRARNSLNGARRIARAIGGRSLEYMCDLTEAELEFSLRREQEGSALLRQALRLGKALGLAGLPWWTRDRIARLYAHALDAGIEPDYVKEAVRRHALAPPADIPADDWPWPIKVYTLGRFAVVKDGTPLRFKGKTQRRPLELLMALIALGGRGVPIEKLTDALWPDADADAAYRVFTVALHRLRRLLGSDAALRLTHNRLTLEPRDVWVDAWSFERLLSAAEREGDEADLTAAARKVLSLYHGRFLDGVDATWALSSRARLQTRFLRFAIAHARRLMRMGLYDQAIVLLEQGLAADDLAEELYLELMQCYRALDRPADALSVYHRCRQALKAGLDLAPSPEIERFRQTLQQPSAARSDRRTGVTSDVPSTSA
ncbi:MAG: BTAD domain-containing putative transcriptional regulator [Nitrospirota bacterium]